MEDSASMMDILHSGWIQKGSQVQHQHSKKSSPQSQDRVPAHVPASRFVDYLKEVKHRCRVKPILVSLGDDITSAPTLISRPKSLKSGQNFQENQTKSGSNLILFRTCFTKNGLIRTLGQFYRFNAIFH